MLFKTLFSAEDMTRFFSEECFTWAYKLFDVDGK